MKRPPIIPPIENTRHQECYDMFMVGFNPTEISRRTGLSVEMIYKWSQREEWPERRQAQLKWREELYPAAEAPLVKAFAGDGRDAIVKRFETRMDTVADKTSEHFEKLAKESPEKLVEAGAKVEAIDKMNRRTLKLDAEDAGAQGHISLTFLTGDASKMVRVIEQPKPPQLEDKPFED